MILVAGLHRVSWHCFLGVSAAVFITIFTVVLTYVVSTAATYSMLLALRPRGTTPVSTASARPYAGPLGTVPPSVVT